MSTTSRPAVAADDADVDVEGLEAGHPAAVGDLDEAGVVGDVTRRGRACGPGYGADGRLGTRNG